MFSEALPRAAVIIYTAISQLSLPNWTKQTIEAAAFLTIYATIAQLAGAINKTDIKLREIINELGSYPI